MDGSRRYTLNRLLALAHVYAAWALLLRSRIRLGAMCNAATKITVVALRGVLTCKVLQI